MRHRLTLLHLADLLQQALVHADLLLVHRAADALGGTTLLLGPDAGRRVNGAGAALLDSDLAGLDSLEGEQVKAPLARGLVLVPLNLPVDLVLGNDHRDVPLVFLALYLEHLPLLGQLLVEGGTDFDVTRASPVFLCLLRLLGLGVPVLLGAEQPALHLALGLVAPLDDGVGHSLHGFLDTLLAGGPLVRTPLVLLLCMLDGVGDQLLGMRLFSFLDLDAALLLDLVLLDHLPGRLALLLLLLNLRLFLALKLLLQLLDLDEFLGTLRLEVALAADPGLMHHRVTSLLCCHGLSLQDIALPLLLV